MCFYFRASPKVLEKLEHQYDQIDGGIREQLQEQYNGFQHPFTPVVAHNEPGRVQLMNWGLIPHWARDKSIQNNTLNARMETLSEKPAFRYSLNSRCLVYADGFYEWQWLDAHGKQKRKYLITLPDGQPFCFAGLWNAWKDPLSGLELKTYTIITRPANELMSQIHNHGQRMPWILPAGLEPGYLAGGPVAETTDELAAVVVSAL